MPRIAVRVTDDLARRVKEAAKSRDLDSPSAFLRLAIQNELRQGESAISQIEERIAASLMRLAKEVRALHTAQLATFSLIDSLAKVFLTCVPEPPAEVIEQAKGKAKRRYQKLLVAVAQGMAGDSRVALKELSRVDD